ncbi:hypothetical protein FACS1894104_3900 [Actinomycetota bacterium]|nr:hypothetical protein FACS1894104_3900 [Actinomycetota bacterium]
MTIETPPCHSDTHPVPAFIAGPTVNAIDPATSAGTKQGKETPPGNLGLLRHFDLYRLEDSTELDDIDYFGLLEDEQAVSIVEWGDKFLDALPQQYLKINITDQGQGLRKLAATAVGQRAQDLLSALTKLSSLKQRVQQNA